MWERGGDVRYMTIFYEWVTEQFRALSEQNGKIKSTASLPKTAHATNRNLLTSKRSAWSGFALIRVNAMYQHACMR